jgi:hypothetical protein
MELEAQVMANNRDLGTNEMLPFQTSSAVLLHPAAHKQWLLRYPKCHKTERRA